MTGFWARRRSGIGPACFVPTFALSSFDEKVGGNPIECLVNLIQGHAWTRPEVRVCCGMTRSTNESKVGAISASPAL
jgi:hypothetical protein